MLVYKIKNKTKKLLVISNNGKNRKYFNSKGNLKN